MNISHNRKKESVKGKGELLTNIRKRKRVIYKCNSVEDKNFNRKALINNKNIIHVILL
jgi:hypothetical protein